MTRSIHPVMVGTAGHIDHGKSSLVRALTGVDPDRLKEEKERGLTIDLGFAPLELADGRLVGMVDVPGHEKFVRNMVAGSTALDLAVLVIAADDSVMPQTVEHLEIVDLLGVRGGLVALTKIDLVDEETVLLAEEEIEELLQGTCLEGSEIRRLSTITGEGVPAFRKRLEELASAIEPRPAEGPFRMSVQRVFQLKGIGSVVTGIPNTGSIGIGDEVEFLPGGMRSKVRAIQAYGGDVDRATAGHSTALSVPDVKLKNLARGVVAAQPQIFTTGNAIDVELRVLPRAPKLPHRTPIRFHSGTAESIGILLVLEGDHLEPGSTTIARLVLEDEVCVGHGDRFLLRLLNPVRTVGGGQVFRISEAAKRYRRTAVADEVKRLLEAGSDPRARVFESVTRAGADGCPIERIAAELAIGDAEARALLVEHEDVHWHERGRRGFLPSEIEEGRKSVLASVERMLRDKPLAASIMRTALRTTRTFPAELKDAVLDAMIATGKVRNLTGGKVLFVDRLSPLPEPDQRDLDRLIAFCNTRDCRPPTEAEIGTELGMPADRVTGLLARAQDEGRVEPVGDHWYDAGVIRGVLHHIRDNAIGNGEVLDIPALRDRLDTSRKYLIPLLEYVDSLGLTRLRGGERRLLTTSPLCEELAGERA